MRGTLDLRRLRYFLIIADRGSMSAAARALNLAQPALSYHVAELERLTGHILFERSHEGVRLTEAGRVLRRHADDIVGRVDTAERELDRLARNRALPEMRVRIAVITSLAADLTPILVERVAESLPAVTLHIMETGTRDMVQRLERGTLDMAVYLSATPGRNEQPIASEQLFFVSPTGAGTTESNDDSVRFIDLARQPLVLPASGNPLREFLEASARRHSLTLDVVLEVDGSRPRWTAVLNGIGGTVLGAHTVESEALDPGLVVREIVAPRLFRPIYLGVRRGFDPLAASQMREVLTASLARLGLVARDGGVANESML